MGNELKSVENFQWEVEEGQDGLIEGFASVNT